MKKILGITLFLMGAIGFSATAQTKSKTDTAGRKNIIEKAGDKTAEVAVKGKATVIDKVYKDKVGPDGQTIYIDRHSKYYWVDKQGHNVYVDKSKLKPKQN